MARRRLTAKANSNRDPRGDIQIALLVGDGLPALRNNCVHEPFCLRATLYAYRWPGAAPASTPCPREGAGPCPSIPCGGGASPDENGATATLGRTESQGT